MKKTAGYLRWDVVERIEAERDKALAKIEEQQNEIARLEDCVKDQVEIIKRLRELLHRAVTYATWWHYKRTPDWIRGARDVLGLDFDG